MNAHTPGPWLTQASDVYNEAGQVVCDPHPNDYQIRAGAGRIPGSEREANARLIAAAPEMLNALELALATIERLKPSKPYDSTQGTRDVINAAITRATGRERGE